VHLPADINKPDPVRARGTSALGSPAEEFHPRIPGMLGLMVVLWDSSGVLSWLLLKAGSCLLYGQRVHASANLETIKRRPHTMLKQLIQ
jgi:hypothetical protein